MRGIDRLNRRRDRLGAGSGSVKPGVGPGRGRGRNRLRPDVLVLEDRRLLATFRGTTTVDTVANDGNASMGTSFLTNLVSLTFGNLTDQTITYGSSTTFTGTLLSAGGQTPAGEGVVVTVNGPSESGAGTIGADGSFSVTVNTSSLSASSLNDAVTYSYAGDATYAATGATSTLTVEQATPTVSVDDAGGTYDGSPFPATATVAGVDGTPSSSLEGVGLTVNYYAGTYTSVSQLFGVPPLPAPSMAGSYTVLASFPGSTDYAAASAMANFRIAPATPIGERHRPGRHLRPFDPLGLGDGRRGQRVRPPPRSRASA